MCALHTLGAYTPPYSVVGVGGPGYVRGIDCWEARLLEVIAIDVAAKVVVIRANVIQ